MEYNRTNWQDHVTEFENRYREVENPDGTITHEPIEGEIIQQGTPINAANLNNMEEGIEQAYDEIGTLKEKTESLEVSRVKKYGVKFSGSNPKGTRVEDAIGLVANVAVDDEVVVNDFDEISFFNRPICCGYHDEDGKFHVNAYRGEPGFAWDGSKGEVYYEETPFYWTGDLHNYVSVSATPLEGYILSPRFKNGVDKEYSPVFWTAIVDLKPTSRSGTFPYYGSMNDHMTEARKYNDNAHTETMAARMSDYILQLVEFATKDVQTVMMGASNMPYSSAAAAENPYRALIAESGANRIVIAKESAERFLVGQTISIGTSYSSDNIAKNRIITSIDPIDSEMSAIYFDGPTVDVAVNNVAGSRPWKNGTTNIVVASSGSPGSNEDGKHPCIWRGKVDPWATAFSAICDVLIIREGEEGSYEYYPHYLEDPTKYATGTLTEDYIKLDYKIANTTGYAKTLGLDKRFPHVRLTDEIGASSTTYLSAYLWAPNGDIRVPFVGGYLSYGRNCSPVYFHCHNVPSTVSWYRLARLFVNRA